MGLAPPVGMPFRKARLQPTAGPAAAQGLGSHDAEEGAAVRSQRALAVAAVDPRLAVLGAGAGTGAALRGGEQQGQGGSATAARDVQGADKQQAEDEVQGGCTAQAATLHVGAPHAAAAVTAPSEAQAAFRRVLRALRVLRTVLCPAVSPAVRVDDGAPGALSPDLPLRLCRRCKRGAWRKHQERRGLGLVRAQGLSELTQLQELHVDFLPGPSCLGALTQLTRLTMRRLHSLDQVRCAVLRCAALC